MKELENGVPASVIANTLNVNLLTIKSWEKNKDKLIQWQDEHDDAILKTNKRMRKINNDLVDKATWIWFKEKQAAGIPVQGVHLQIQAQYFHTVLKGQGQFNASNGWLHKWQIRHNIRSVTICGEKLSADKNAAENFKVEFSQYINEQDLSLDQIFNCDETGLNYKLLPKTTLSSTSETSASGFKGKKERITVMACSNASGSLKLPLVVIGKYAKPRAIKHLTSLSVYYKNQKSAWMNKEIFTEWFQCEFVPRVTEFLKIKGLPLKAVLYVDNCTAHPNILSKDNIISRFFPPNTTSLIQPMDQSCLQCLKLQYRQKLMTYIIDCVNRGETLQNSLKKITIKEVIFWASSAWEHVSPVTIRKSWNKLISYKDSQVNTGAIHTTATESSRNNEENPRNVLCNQFHEILQQTNQYTNLQVSDVNTWLQCPSLMLPDECLTDKEIVELIKDVQIDEAKVDKENASLSQNETQDIPNAIVGLNNNVTIFEACKALNA
ncbi:jerky protein homolog-like, partial [Pseudomyrmex gracilis]|uniref:jerky protein homolog-like n=1 Tax=Pseudomyrmex gracilis TaxID=219809 RepID=UPI000995190D